MDTESIKCSNQPCEHAIQCDMLCTHPIESIYVDEKWSKNRYDEMHFGPPENVDSVEITHSAYIKGECEHKNVCSLIFVKYTKDKSILVENGNKVRFIIPIYAAISFRLKND